MTRSIRGYLISIEGIDGAGKSTQVKMLKEWLEKEGHNVAHLKEPTQGQYGKEIYRLAAEHMLPGPEEELRLFMLDRKEDVEKNILPALRSGDVVIMDRYYQSNMAYQGAKGLNPEKIREENEKFSPVPDLIIVLDIDPKNSISRIVNNRKSALDHFESENYLIKVREIFLKIGEKPNAAVIDASGKPDEVHGKIVDTIKNKLPELSP
ncbi:dTMP kinase [Methanocella sp. CWC-04]|uniref:Probable thymidylate kinase n=1 Tax=Methanooceanicella nereidis TaxID=2052831 RepID=A0AAP2RFA1_9EURY|nr:dTMP kinase [Methanocella sp. CWC-04]MCD1296002.1 dTMP kinase [Methanocella sp. CWC-04]